MCSHIGTKLAAKYRRIFPNNRIIKKNHAAPTKMKTLNDAWYLMKFHMKYFSSLATYYFFVRKTIQFFCVQEKRIQLPA